MTSTFGGVRTFTVLGGWCEILYLLGLQRIHSRIHERRRVKIWRYKPSYWLMNYLWISWSQQIETGWLADPVGRPLNCWYVFYRLEYPSRGLSFFSMKLSDEKLTYLFPTIFPFINIYTCMFSGECNIISSTELWLTKAFMSVGKELWF